MKPKTHCKHGHEFDEANTYLYYNKRKGKDVRTCRKCNLARQWAIIKRKA